MPQACLIWSRWTRSEFGDMGEPQKNLTADYADLEDFRESLSFKKAGVFVVSSSRAQRIAALADLKNWRVRLQLIKELERMGITKELESAGISNGDVVRLGLVEMKWGQ